MTRICFRGYFWIALLLTTLVLGVSTLKAQSSEPTRFVIGHIDFFGTGTVPLEPLRPTLTLQEGDTLSEVEINPSLAELKRQLGSSLGHPPTDAALVCCDDRGQWTIYIGLGSGATSSPTLLPRPIDHINLSNAIDALYAQEEIALLAAVRAGNAGEDDSKGYTLSTDSALRSIQLQLRSYAVEHGKHARRILAESASARQRTIAAQLVGYSLRSNAQIAALVLATKDSESSVRNNVTRALYVLATASPATAEAIPPDSFIAMLNSGTWSDRNKSSFLLMHLTKSRNPCVLQQFRDAALPSLIEMARWQSAGHAVASQVMLGRIAGLPESQIDTLIHDGQINAIIAAANETATPTAPQTCP